MRGIEWAAGFWEGEGTVGLRSAGASQTTEWPLLELVRLFGGRINVAYEAQGNQKKCWQWWVCGEEGRVFIAAIYPYLSPRRQQQIDNKFITEEKRKRHRASLRTACQERATLRGRNSQGQFDHATIS